MSNVKKFRRAPENILKLTSIIIGVVSAILLGAILQFYQLFASDNFSLMIATMLNIVSLIVFLFGLLSKLTSLTFFLIAFIIFFDLIVLVFTLNTTQHPLSPQAMLSLLYIFPVVLVYLTKLTKPNSFRGISIEALGGLYRRIFFVQSQSFLLLIYENSADIFMKSLCGLIALFLSSVTIYLFDRRVRSTNLMSVSFKETPKKLRNATVNIRLVTVLEKFIQMKCLIKPVIDELSEALTLSLVAVPLLLLIVIALPPNIFGSTQPGNIVVVAFSGLVAFISTLSIEAKLYTKCKIDLISLGYFQLPLQFGEFKKLRLVPIIILIVFFAYLMTSIPIHLVLPLLSLLLALSFFTVPFIIFLSTTQAINIIEHITEMDTLTKLSNEQNIQQLESLVFSLIMFLTFISYSTIMCLRHNAKCKEG